MDSVASFHSEPGEHSDGAQLSRGLGWFSLALGTAELAAPRMLARAIGIEADRRSSWILRAFGVRELAAGVAILLQPRRPWPVWSRVAGDVLDIATMATAAITRRTSGTRVAATLATLGGAVAIDTIAAQRVQRAYAASNEPVIFSVTINRPAREVYEFYRRFDQLPVFMDWLDEVRVLDDRTSHWTARLPVVGSIGWDAEIVDERHGELIEWRAVEGSPLALHGKVTFAKTPGRDMTEVRVQMELGLPGTKPSAALAKLFAKPQIKGDLRRLKMVLETGEVLRSDASAHTMPHPGQPSPDAKEAPPFFIEPVAQAQKGVVS